jgi:FSR family fosmidomycin resistance protein-like MFS transporter
LIILPRGQSSVAWFASVAIAGILVLVWIGRWYRSHGMRPRAAQAQADVAGAGPRADVRGTIAILLTLVFSKYVYITSVTSYYMFFLISRFGVSTRDAQFHLFVFLGAVALGTFMGGPIGDRVGRKPVILVSIAGVLPFTLLLPYTNLFWTTVLSGIIGVILSSAFSAILVFAQELLPHRVGLVSGLFFGFAFGVAGAGAAALGVLADATSIEFVYRLCAFLPALGLLAFWLPNSRRSDRRLT